MLATLAILVAGAASPEGAGVRGIFFNMIGALVSHVAHDDPAWTVAATATIAALLAFDLGSRTDAEMLR